MYVLLNNMNIVIIVPIITLCVTNIVNFSKLTMQLTIPVFKLYVSGIYEILFATQSYAYVIPMIVQTSMNIHDRGL